MSEHLQDCVSRMLESTEPYIAIVDFAQQIVIFVYFTDNPLKYLLYTYEHSIINST